MFLLLAATLLLVTGLGAWLASDRMERVAQIYDEATIYETAAGPQQAIVRGEGSPVLVLHGQFGGCDRGMWLARFVGMDDTMEVIAPSRPGYLGTPLDGRISAEAQVEALAALLDTLERSKVAMLVEDTATDVALTFAEKFPERVSNLAIVYGNFTPKNQRALQLAYDYRDNWKAKFLAPLTQIVAKMAPASWPEINATRGFPIDLRLPGMIADGERLSQTCDLPKPSVPALIVLNSKQREQQGNDFDNFLSNHPLPPNVIILPDVDFYSPEWIDTAKAIREFLSGSAETPEQP